MKIYYCDWCGRDCAKYGGAFDTKVKDTVHDCCGECVVVLNQIIATQYLQKIKIPKL